MPQDVTFDLPFDTPVSERPQYARNTSEELPRAAVLTRPHTWAETATRVPVR
ncbi:hypothetical protein ACFWIJ_46445 [Streptomyces sp. NPDC127079]|uniref:hypothetical protein n=1 Tax=Streptomyces sp. NPDC127079 TaxID=3347132 RepID=UPI003650B1FB